MLTFGVQALACLAFINAHPAFATDLAPITKDGVTLRFVAKGEFQESRVQGMELELVNTTDQPITCEVRLTLYRTSPNSNDFREVQRAEKQTQIPAHARQGFRVAEQLTYGQCRIEYEVKVNGAVFASNRYAFQASGPYRIEVRPWLLTRNAMQVNVELLEPDKTDQQFRFKLLDKNRKKVLFQSDEFTRIVNDSPSSYASTPKIVIQGFVSFAKQRPGDYVVEVEVLDSSSKTPVALARLYHPVAIPSFRHD